MYITNQLYLFILIFLIYFFNSVTIVCIFSLSLHPTPASPTSLPHLYPLPWFCHCVLYSSSYPTILFKLQLPPSSSHWSFLPALIFLLLWNCFHFQNTALCNLLTHHVYCLFSLSFTCTLSLEYHINEGRDLCLSCSLIYPKFLEEYLVYLGVQ